MELFIQARNAIQKSKIAYEELIGYSPRGMYMEFTVILYPYSYERSFRAYKSDIDLLELVIMALENNNLDALSKLKSGDF